MNDIRDAVLTIFGVGALALFFVAVGYAGGKEAVRENEVCPLLLEQQTTLADSLAFIQDEPLCQWWDDE